MAFDHVGRGWGVSVERPCGETWQDNEALAECLFQSGEGWREQRCMVESDNVAWFGRGIDC